MNQIGMRKSTGIPRKEFIETLGGNYLIVNNLTDEVSGSAPTTFGYRNVEVVTVKPTLISDGDNGSTYDVSNWFNFTSGSLYSTISANYPAFHSLLVTCRIGRYQKLTGILLFQKMNFTPFLFRAQLPLQHIR